MHLCVILPGLYYSATGIFVNLIWELPTTMTCIYVALLHDEAVFITWSWSLPAIVMHAK